MAPEILARFWKLIEKPEDPDGCWIWTGYVNTPGRPRGRHGRNRYPRPRFMISGGHYQDGHRIGQLHVYAHRLTLALVTGMKLEDAAELEAHHLCANPGHRETHAAERFGSFI